MKANKTINLNIRTTESMYNKIKKNAANKDMKISEYIRYILQKEID